MPQKLVFVWYRSLQKSHHNLNNVKIIIPFNIANHTASAISQNNRNQSETSTNIKPTEMLLTKLKILTSTLPVIYVFVCLYVEVVIFIANYVLLSLLNTEPF